MHERSRGHCGEKKFTLQEKVRGLSDFFLRDGKTVYTDPKLYDEIVNNWFGRRNLAEVTADVVVGCNPTTPGMTVLELGSGTGVLTLPLAQSECCVTATDIEQNALDYLEAKAEDAQLGDNISIIQLNFNEPEWSFEAESYDVVTSLRTNRYIENFPKYLTNIHRVLKPEGSLVLPVFPLDSVPWKMHSVQGIHQPTSLGNIEGEIRKNGFVIDVVQSMSWDEAKAVYNREVSVPFYYKPQYIVARKK